MDLQKEVYIGEIVAFDLKESIFFEIAVPNIYDEVHSGLRVFRGYLGVWDCEHHEFVYNIWVMKEYKVQTSWTRIRVVARDISRSLLFPICLTVNVDFFGTDGYPRLVKFNDRGKVVEIRWKFYHPGDCGLCGRLRKECICGIVIKKTIVVLHTESLLSLPCDS